MGCALGAGMQAVMFRLKRAFHRSLAFVRPLIAEFGLTPARFDMMRAIYGLFERQTDTLQSEVRRILGVTAATVSRMLKSLEALGFVVRRRDRDKRERVVTLTEEGERRFLEARAALVQSGALDLVVASVLTKPDRWGRRHDDAHAAVCMLDEIRRAFDDVANDALYEPSWWFAGIHSPEGHPQNWDIDIFDPDGEDEDTPG